MNKCLEKFAAKEKPKETFAEKRARLAKSIKESLSGAKNKVKGQVLHDKTGKVRKRAKGAAALLGAGALGAGGYAYNERENES